jgi:hypothetical protein
MDSQAFFRGLFTRKFNFNVTLLKQRCNQVLMRRLLQFGYRLIAAFGPTEPCQSREVLNPMRGLILEVVTIAIVLVCPSSLVANAWNQGQNQDASEFGPVVRAYLGYLQNEQEVVDDRASRHEVNQAYYRRNSNRIRALRQMAVRIARESRNDYLPELEAVTRDEMRLLFEQPPQAEMLHEGVVLRNTFRFLGMVRAVETFYIFARLDPYEQAELAEQGIQEAPVSGNPKPTPVNVTRARRATTP